MIALALAAALAAPVSPARIDDWASRLRAGDAKTRASAEADLAAAGRSSFPLLRRFLVPGSKDLHAATFRVLQRIGPPAIPLLAELLRHESDSVRQGAVSELVDLAPHTASIQLALRQALRDDDAMVAGDAARALGALGAKASPSVDALVEALSHEDPYLRIYAAEALASIGPKAARATRALADALGDPVPGVRWAACEGLGSLGPAAESAVPRLIAALQDEFLYVRIFAAGALGNIGPGARSARAALQAAAADPALREEAEWALQRISGVQAPAPKPQAGTPPNVALPRPASAVPAGRPPVDWDATTGRNIAWSVELGNETFGRPVVAGDVVYVGTDNARRRDPALQEEAGVLLGDVTASGLLWTSRQVGRVVGTPVAGEGLLYVGDLGGTLHCLEAATGARVWTHETGAPIWGSLRLAGDRLYVGNEEGRMTVLRAGRRHEVLGQMEMDAPLYSPPAPVGDSLYLATANRLYRIAANPSSY